MSAYGAHRRFRYVGDPTMPLNMETLSCVGLIIDSGGTPIGSGFVVLKENEEDRAHKHGYFVTAKQVVADEIDVSVRFLRMDGTIETESASDWEHHPHFDVSATPLGDRNRGRSRAYGIPIDTRIATSGVTPVPGSPV